MPSVLLDARLVLPKPTGIGQYVVSLVPELLALAPDWTFHLLRRPDSWPDYGVRGWSAPNLVHHETGERHMSLVQHLRIPRRARALGVDVLHYPHFDAPVFFGSVPVVSTIHGMMHVLPGEHPGRMSAPKRAYARFSYGATIRRSAAVLVVSQTAADEIAKRYGVTDRVHVTPLAADPRFRPADDVAIRQFRAAYGISRPFVLFVGEFRPHKNFGGLLRAWARAERRATHDLVLLGLLHPGDESPEAEVRRLGLAGSVRVLTDVPRDRLVAAYSAADLFVLPSLYEGFGLPVLEAMACDVPVVTSRTTATAEVAGPAGALVDPHDAGEIAATIDRILGSEAERRRRIEAGREWCTRFTWRHTAELTLEAYRRVRGGRR
jgi:glycosyltransferase involved in cell wall biosynthesis